MLDNLLMFVGGKCKHGHEIKILESNAGYYIGTLAYDEDCGCDLPNCRISDYGETPTDKNMNYERNCVENCWCNGTGVPDGCELCIDAK